MKSLNTQSTARIPWTAAETVRLQECASLGMSLVETAAEMGRTYSTLYMRARLFGVKFTPKKRECPRPSKRMEWMQAHVAHEGNDCLIWPFSRDWHGYGQLGPGPGLRGAHQVMCELVNGPRPPDHQASHSCGRGHEGCVHPRHLSWKTRSENHLDRRRHGTHATSIWGRQGKLTVEQTRQVLALKGQMGQREIAAQFGISRPTVRNIFKGKSRVAKRAMEQSHG